MSAASRHEPGQDFFIQKRLQDTSTPKKYWPDSKNIMKHRIWQIMTANDLRKSWFCKFSDLWTNCEIEKLSVTALIADSADNAHIRAIHDCNNKSFFQRWRQNIYEVASLSSKLKKRKDKVFLHLAASKGTLKHPDVFLFCFGFLCWPNSIESSLGVLAAPSPKKNVSHVPNGDWANANLGSTFSETQLPECWRSNYKSDH